MESRTQSCRADAPVCSHRHQEGFTLAALIVILTIMSIIVAFTVPPQWSMIMHRERDKQTIFQMRQAARAIMIWNVRNPGTYPTSLDQLKEAKQPRILRFNGEDFVMPLTGSEDDWILVPEAALETATPIVQNTQTPNQQPLFPPSKLREGASPNDFVGPFVGVRPNKTGKSFIALNGAEDYSQWVYTTRDLQNEINMRVAAMNVK
jgi:type II secretory pathway pseudopilin PulG